MPACAQPTQGEITAYMDAVIKGYLLFMADKPESEVTTQFKMAETLLSPAMRWLVELKGQTY